MGSSFRSDLNIFVVFLYFYFVLKIQSSCKQDGISGVLRVLPKYTFFKLENVRKSKSILIKIKKHLMIKDLTLIVKKLLIIF